MGTGETSIHKPIRRSPRTEEGTGRRQRSTNRSDKRIRVLKTSVEERERGRERITRFCEERRTKDRIIFS